MSEETKSVVAIIEDEKFLSNLLKFRLEREGFLVQQLFDGIEALAWLKSNRPNLILLDLIMPKASGFEVLEQMSLDPQVSGVPIIVLSNLGQDSDVAKVKQFGASEFYVKARVSTEEVVNRVKQLLQGGA